MLLSELTNRQIATFIYNHESKGLVSRGGFTLAQLLQETNRRVPEIPFGTVDTARLILKLSNRSPNGLTTYGDIWKSFGQDEPWVIFTSRPAVTNALERVGFYCIEHGLPLIITLVVDDAKFSPTESAKDNIYDYWVLRGLTPDQERDSFLENQQCLSRQVTLDDIASGS